MLPKPWLAVVILIFSGLSHAQDSLISTGERSGWKRTGHYEEAQRLCRAFARAYPARVRCDRYGQSPEGRDLVALIVRAKSKDAPVVWIQAGIHAGEIDGKDAMFALLREWLPKARTPLDSVTLIFVPVVNVDGHERFGPHNRPNQIGPEEMGWRTTAQNLNLNRDFAKVEAAEMQALLRLWNRWDPIVSADLHVTDGAKFQPDVGIVIEPADFGPEPLKQAAKKLESEVMEKLTALHHLPLPFYPDLEVDDNPAEGFTKSVPTARLGDGYWSKRGRIGILVEAHSWKTYAERARVHRDFAEVLLTAAARDGRAWIKAAQETGAVNLKAAGQTIALEYQADPKQVRTIEFPGYAYRREHSDVSGATRVIYDDSKPEIWKIPYRDAITPSLTIQAPVSGYVIPPAYRAVIQPKLDLHAITYRVVSRAETAPVEVFRATTTEFGKTPYEGRQTLKVKGEWKGETRQIAAGSLFVPIGQKNSLLAMILFEPLSVDSFLSWGFFNAAFEKKEYMEAYVAEEVAREMLKTPAVREAFDRRLKDDADFAKNPSARLEFFYRRHPSWDDRFNLYPVFRRGYPSPF